MPIHYIHHRTHYHYPHWVMDSANQIKLYPLHDENQRVLDHRLVISGNPTVSTLQDAANNTTGFFTVVQPHRELSIESICRVELRERKLAPRQSAAKVWAQLRHEQSKINLHDYLLAEVTNNQLAIESAVQPNSIVHPLDELLRIAEFVYENFEYKKGVTTVETNVDDIWNLRAGVCQDFAHLLLYMMRLRGVPCRYISGYICPGNNEWRGEGATHAWVEAWLPDVGWIGIDPTNKCLAGDRHVRLAVGRNFGDCTPVKGTYKGAAEHLLEVTVQFSSEDFSDEQLVAKPVTPEQQTYFKNRIDESYDSFTTQQQQ